MTPEGFDEHSDPARGVEDAALDLARVVRARLDAGHSAEEISRLLGLPVDDVIALAERAP